MTVGLDDQDAADDVEPFEGDFLQACSPIRLNLPEADADILVDAREAIQREFRDPVKWKRLRCCGVKVLSATETGTVYILDVGRAVEFDWTWEGSVAFRPLLLNEFADDRKRLFENGADDFEIEDSVLWSGEILEVDEATGRIFVVIANPECPPRTGSFYVRPFEFLSFLNAVFQEPSFDQIRERLPSRLLATQGGLHPEVDSYRDVGMPQLQPCWSKAWSVLWGPPGTGKTYTTGHQVANILADESERILVVSTTNRATDAAAIAIAIGRAAKQVAPAELAGGSLLRIGKGEGKLPQHEADHRIRSECPLPLAATR